MDIQAMSIWIFVVLVHNVYGTTMGEGHYSPKFIDDIPERSNVTGHVGKHVRLMCKADANPKSFNVWHKDGQRVAKSKRFRIYKNFMLIKKFSPEDAGEYKCTAINPFGQIIRKFEVSVGEAEIDKPGFDKRHNADFLNSLKAQLDNLKEKFEASVRNDLHLHVTRGEEEEHTVTKLKDGKHVYLNILMNGQHSDRSMNEEIQGHCEMKPNMNVPGYGMIKGNIHLIHQTNESVIVDIHLSGFEMTDESSHNHGFHIHQFGDMSDGCESLGSIYDRKSSRVRRHRPHSNHRTIVCDDNGEVHMRYTDDTLSLHGKHSIMGRSFVIHDDLEGKRIACCVIGRAEAHDHNEMDRERIHFTEQLIEHHDRNPNMELVREDRPDKRFNKP